MPMNSSKDGTRFYSSLLVTGKAGLQFYEADGVADILGIIPDGVQAAIDAEYKTFRQWCAEQFNMAAQADGFTIEEIERAAQAPDIDLKCKRLPKEKRPHFEIKQTDPLPTFVAAAGEISPVVNGRVDMEKYVKGLAAVKNFIREEVNEDVPRRPGRKHPNALARLLARLKPAKPVVEKSEKEPSPELLEELKKAMKEAAGPKRPQVTVHRVRDLSELPPNIRAFFEGRAGTSSDDDEPDGGVPVA